MQNNLSFIITDKNIVVNFDGQTHIIPNKGQTAEQLILALKAGDENDIQNLVDAAKRLELDSGGLFTAKNGKIKVDGKAAHRSIEQKIADFMAEGLPYEPLRLFLEKINQNPSERAKNELYAFLEKNNHPLTADGNFIGYRRVREDYKDIYTGKIDNSPGATPSMPRKEVDPDPNKTCSKGLHIANWYYSSSIYNSGQGIMLEVEVNPKDVVAVPVDYENAKMRVCAYKVLRVVDQENSSTTLVNNTISEIKNCKECGTKLVLGENDNMCVDCEDKLL